MSFLLCGAFLWCAQGQTQPEIIVDNAGAGVTLTGSWTVSTNAPNVNDYYATNFLHDGNTGKGLKSAKFTPALPSAGRYQVFARWAAAGNRANNTLFDVISNTGSTTVAFNQGLNNATWMSLGTFEFNAQSTTGTVSVTVRNDGTSGYVIADAVKWVKVGELTPTPTPTLMPIPTPTAIPTSTPTATPDPTPTKTPTPTPSPTPTPTKTPTPLPTATPTPLPIITPTPTPNPASRKVDILFAGDSGSDNVYQPTPQPQSAGTTVGVAAVYNLVVQNDGDAPDNINVRGDGSTPDWTVRYFDESNQDITDSVKNGRLLTSVDGHSSVSIRLEVTPGATVALNAVKDVVVSVSSQNASWAYDAVKASTTNVATNTYPQPDALIRQSDASFIGEGIYNNTGANQTVSTVGTRGQSFVFEVKVQNDGQFTASYKVKIPTPPSAWNLRLFDAAENGNDITAQAKSANGWPVPLLQPGPPTYGPPGSSPGQSLTLRLQVTVPVGSTQSATFPVRVLGGSTNSVTDVVQATVGPQWIAGMQASVDDGTTWQSAPASGTAVAVLARHMLGLRALKGNPNADWPMNKPTWNKDGRTLGGSDVWVAYEESQVSSTPRTVSGECGNSASIAVQVQSASQ